jgi:hypothetical protein
MARIYRPSGAGPFPTVLDLHGGAWNAKDRHAEEPMDRALAASGVLVVAIDMTLAPEAPYPACVQDANYAVRWLKRKAASWNGDPSKIGIYGSSSGGHVAELLAMRPGDARYNAIPLPEARNVGASVARRDAFPDQRSVCALQERRKLKRDAMVANHTTFFAVRPSTRAIRRRFRAPRGGDDADAHRRGRSATTCSQPCRKFAATYKAAGSVLHFRGQRARMGGATRAADRPRP